jgi:hypothetical protein
MKIFCIGLNKTGTRSLIKGLQILGYRTVHFGGPRNRRSVEQALADNRPLLEDLEDADAYADILALSSNFDVLDRQYPGSKFILTTRDLDEWLDSRKRHVEGNIEAKARGEYPGNFLVIDIEGWTAERVEHEGRVRSYFADRPNDFLVMDIPAGDGWDLLCPFLDVPVPKKAFPRLRDVNP